jgi:L-2-hydroxyglutarate oxidase LhgO
MPDRSYDLLVIGGGIVGLATARELLRRFPDQKLVLLEKEDGLARHQSGRNSGVIHSGIYYKPGSIKAETCVEGAARMLQFCRDHGIPHRLCGKLIVATSAQQFPRLEELARRGQANGIAGLRILSPDEIKEIEPNCSGLRALHVPGAGIVDYVEVAKKFAEEILQLGGEIRLLARVTRLATSGRESIVESTGGTFLVRYVINSAGLESDRIARRAGENVNLRIVPFRGEYYELIPERRHLVRSLIYPVPDPRFPFLGVHFTRRINGQVDAGPNAVLALKREGYRKTDFATPDIWSEVSYPGFWRMVGRYWRTGLGELYRSFSKAAFVRDLQQFVPAVTAKDLVASGSGVRAQAVLADGSFVDDFQFLSSGNVLHVLHVPSPAATASIAIGRRIAQLASDGFGLKSRHTALG